MSSLDDLRIRRLLEVGRGLVAELDHEVVLDRVLDAARELTGARYAALGVLNEQRTELERFLTVGVDEETRRAIGVLPRGRGVLGVLIDDPRPVRLNSVGSHPSSYGFPAHHPPMRSFLGVPIVIRGEAWGNLYLTEKAGGEFSEGDEEAAVILADWAAVAIQNARLYGVSERRRVELERAVRGLEAVRDVAIAIGGDIGLGRVLELIVKRGRALIDAGSALIMLREGLELVVVASAGRAGDAPGRRVPIVGSASGEVLERRRAERISDLATRLGIAPGELGVPDARSALLVPMAHAGEAVGVLAAFDRGVGRDAFGEEDERLLGTFAASAANAVVMARSVEADRLRSSVAAADAERSHWARELHDETLQGLGGLRVLLASALRRGDPAHHVRVMGEAVGQIELELENLRAIITELRPVVLDELGLRPAIESLVEQRRRRGEFEIRAELRLPGEAGDGRLDPELETTVYRLVQEALTNVAKHARASNVRVAVIAVEEAVMVEVRDDGRGFALNARRSGFGLAGMRERVDLAGGTLEIDSDESGTVVRAHLLARQARGAGLPSGAQQAAR